MLAKIHQTYGVAPRTVALLSILFLAPIHPSSIARTRWDFYILILVFYTCIAQPYIICFGISTKLSDNLAVGILETAVDCSFVLDIYWNIRTGYTNEQGTVILDRRSTFQYYITTWFGVDMISVIPWDILISSKKVILKLTHPGQKPLV